MTGLRTSVALVVWYPNHGLYLYAFLLLLEDRLVGLPAGHPPLNQLTVQSAQRARLKA